MITLAQYVITDGSRWIMINRNGKYVPTSCEALADTFSNKAANNLYNNSLPKALKSVFYIQKIDTPPDNVKQITQSEVENNTEKVMVAENIQKWINKITDLNGLATDALHRKEELCEELSFVDRELSDINHYIEFCNLNAAQGWKAYKMIKERRIKRRSIKNEIQILNIILDKKISDTVTNEILESMSKMDKRTYEPRVMNELFDL